MPLTLGECYPNLIYICSITDIEHTLFINIANNTIYIYNYYQTLIILFNFNHLFAHT